MRQKWVNRQNAYMFEDNQIGYFVTVTLDSVGHNSRYMIVGERNRWTAGDVHEAEFFLEPLRESPGFRWDVSNWDEDEWVY